MQSLVISKKEFFFNVRPKLSVVTLVKKDLSATFSSVGAHFIKFCFIADLLDKKNLISFQGITGKKVDTSLTSLYVPGTLVEGNSDLPIN